MARLEIGENERASDEVTGFMGARVAPAGVSVKNPAFDVTPAELVSALITEKGVVTAPAVFTAGWVWSGSRTPGIPHATRSVSALSAALP